MFKKTILTLAITGLAHTTYATPPKGDIYAKGTDAYVIDQENRIVRDNFGGCVRSINWTKETALPICEGWPEQKTKPKPQLSAPIASKPEPQPEPEPEPVVEKQTVEEPIPIFRGLFKTNRAELNDNAFGKLDLIVEYMNKYPAKRILVEGHTDNQGSAAYNKNLSLRRAQAVKNYLVSKGITADRIEIIGYGESQPIADNSTPEGRQLNRRVEIKLIKL